MELTGTDLFINHRTFPIKQNASTRFLGCSFLPIIKFWEVMDGLIFIENAEPLKFKKIILNNFF